MARVPLAPQWNINNGCVCTPDGGLLYVGSRSINFISFTGSDGEYANIRAFHTRQSILSLDIDPNWGEVVSEQVDISEKSRQQKLFVVLSEDNSVQIWDFDKGCALQGHKAHLACMRYMEGNGPSPQHAGEVFISYMINRNVLSMDNQDIVVYCIASNSFYRRPTFLYTRKHQISTLKCSPLNENHFAVGTKRGLVLLCDLQKMVTLFTLRGHDTCVASLAWCRFELESGRESVETKIILKEDKSEKTQKLTRSDTKIVDADDIFDIYDYDYLDNEFGTAAQDTKTELVSDFVGIEKPSETAAATQFDFVEACQSLKEEINALRADQIEISPENVISLEDCKKAKFHDDTSSCSSENGEEDKINSEKHSSDGSMVRLVCGTPSSEDSVDIYGMQRVICQAEVHAALATEAKNVLVQTPNDKMAEDPAAKSQDSAKVAQPAMIVAPIDILLASISNDGTVTIWNTVTGATCDHHKIQSSHVGKKNRLHISWYEKTSFVVSNQFGDLQMWKMKKVSDKEAACKFQNKRYKFEVCKRQWLQRRVVAFSICPKRHLLWCIQSNREISLEDIRENKIKLQYGCVSTNISTLRECPDNMNKIAIGFSDRRIGIIDISKMTSKQIHIENYMQRFESPVLALVWSPDSKKIAFGTDEGRVGIINVESAKQQTLHFNPVCGKKIYSISWQENHLYVVCNDRIAVYEDNPHNKDGVILPGISSVSAITHRGKYLFVGTNKGKLQMYERKENEIFSLEYKMKSELELSSRYITEMSWSPIAKNVLAVVANSNSVHILEFKPETGELSITRKIVIKSHKAANGCVKWSNRNENLLLTCGFDGAIRVWDLSREGDDERFVKLFHCPMTCGLFLPTDEDILLCSGKSTSLEFIDMRTEKTENQDTKMKRLNNRTIDNVQWATKATARLDDKKSNRRANKNIDNIKSSENHLQSNTSQNTPQICTNGEEVSKMLAELNIQKVENSANNTSIYMKNPQTLLYLTRKELNKDALNVMHTMMTDEIIHAHSDNKSLCSKLFGTKTEAKLLLQEELKNHQNSETKGISNIFMPQLNGNLKDEILKNIQTKQLCEWHVSLAPSISYSFWKKCCEAYAEQLVEQGYVLQGASYYLALHQQGDAINVLVKQFYFKEAMLIGKIYLQPDDPLLALVTDSWITYLYNNGNLTAAALLCFLSKQNDRAYECLVKIRDSSPDIERVLRLLKKHSSTVT